MIGCEMGRERDEAHEFHGEIRGDVRRMFDKLDGNAPGFRSLGPNLIPNAAVLAPVHSTPLSRIWPELTPV